MRQIHTKTPIHTLEGFTLCSVRIFKDPFSLLLNQEIVEKLNMALGILDTRSIMLVHVKVRFSSVSHLLLFSLNFKLLFHARTHKLMLVLGKEQCFKGTTNPKESKGG